MLDLLNHCEADVRLRDLTKQILNCAGCYAKVCQQNLQNTLLNLSFPFYTKLAFVRKQALFKILASTDASSVNEQQPVEYDMLWFTLQVKENLPFFTFQLNQTSMFLVVHSNAQNGTSSVLVDRPPCLFIQVVILTFCTDRVGPLVHFFREVTQKNVYLSHWQVLLKNKSFCCPCDSCKRPRVLKNCMFEHF